MNQVPKSLRQRSVVHSRHTEVQETEPEVVTLIVPKKPQSSELGAVVYHERHGGSVVLADHSLHVSDPRDTNLNPTLGVVQKFFSRPGGLPTYLTPGPGFTSRDPLDRWATLKSP